MNNIEVGEWGRTNLGNIIKFAWLECEEGKRDENKVILIDLMTTHIRPFYYFKKDEHIVNHSKNIIDLIEVGDYVNGCLVLKHSYKPELYVSYVYVGGKVQTTIEDYTNKLEDIEIQTIVTKEQFQAIEYKIGG